MTGPDLQLLAGIAGGLHFCQLPTMLIFQRRVLRLADQLESIEVITRRVFQIIAAAIVVTVLGTGTVVVMSSAEIATRCPLAVALCSFLSVFWGMRACAQCWYAPVWPRTPLARAFHPGLLALFVTESALYLVIGWWPVH